jgi:hypothetical protein
VFEKHAMERCGSSVYRQREAVFLNKFKLAVDNDYASMRHSLLTRGIPANQG